MKHLRVLLMRLGRTPRAIAWILRLPGVERRLLFNAARTAYRVQGALQRFSVVAVIDEQQRRRAQVETVSDGLDAARVAELCAKAMRLFPTPPTCLPRSITMHNELLLRRLPGEIRIGAKREEDSLRFHAWVVSDTTVLMEDPSELADFALFDLDSTTFGAGFQ